MIKFPRTQLVPLQEHAARVLDTRKLGGESEPLARELLAGFFDVCTRAGLDRVLTELERELAPIELTDRIALADHAVCRVLVEKLGSEFVEGGPRGAMPRQLAELVIASLPLELVDEPAQTITLDDGVRIAVLAGVTAVVEAELAVPKIRETIIAKSRARCDERHLASFDKIASQLDDRGMRITRQPKVPLDSAQVVQQILFETRSAIIASIAGAAIDRAKQILARANPEAAARIDQPISLRLTPRDVAIVRLNDARVPKVPASVIQSLVESLVELARLAWRPLERPVRAYAASQTFAVGDLVEHPKFGRGSVLTCDPKRIEVEFADGKVTLVHVGIGK